MSPLPALSEPSTRKIITSASGIAIFASSIRYSPSLFNGLCIPGVSINTICPCSFVRIPFIVEGILIGLISAIFSEGLLYFCYRVATETICATLGTNDIIKYSDLALNLFGLFVIIGVVAGVIGSITMIGKYLHKEGSEFAAI